MRVAIFLCLAVLWSLEATLAKRVSRERLSLVSDVKKKTRSLMPLSPDALSKNVITFFESARNHSDWIVEKGDYCFISVSKGCLLTWVKIFYNVVVAYTNTVLLEFRLGINGKPADERYDVVQKMNPRMSRLSYDHLSRLLKNFVKVLDRDTTLQMLMSVVFGVTKVASGIGSAVKQLFGQQSNASSWACFLRLCLDETEAADKFHVQSRTWWDANIPNKDCTVMKSDEQETDASSELSASVRSPLLEEAMELARYYKITSAPDDTLYELMDKDTAITVHPACVSVGFNVPVAGGKVLPRVLHNVLMSLKGDTLEYATAARECRGMTLIPEKNEIHKINLELVRTVENRPRHCVELTSEDIPSRSFCFPAQDADAVILARAWKEALLTRKARPKRRQNPASLLMRHAAVLSSRHSAEHQNGRDDDAIALPASGPTNGTSLLEAEDALFMLDLQHSNLSQHEVEANRLWRYGAGLIQGARDRAAMEQAQQVLARATTHFMAATGGAVPHDPVTAAAGGTASSSGPLSGFVTVYSIWKVIKFLFGTLKDLFCAIATYKMMMR